MNVSVGSRLASLAAELHFTNSTYDHTSTTGTLLLAPPWPFGRITISPSPCRRDTLLESINDALHSAFLVIFGTRNSISHYDSDTLLVSINDALQWTLAVISGTEKTIRCYDSFCGSLVSTLPSPGFSLLSVSPRLRRTLNTPKNDGVVNGYLAAIVSKAQADTGYTKGATPRVHAFDTGYSGCSCCSGSRCCCSGLVRSQCLSGLGHCQRPFNAWVHEQQSAAAQKSHDDKIDELSHAYGLFSLSRITLPHPMLLRSLISPTLRSLILVRRPCVLQPLRSFPLLSFLPSPRSLFSVNASTAAWVQDPTTNVPAANKSTAAWSETFAYPI